jgi:hypothetical protein
VHSQGRRAGRRGGGPGASPSQCPPSLAVLCDEFAPTMALWLCSLLSPSACLSACAPDVHLCGSSSMVPFGRWCFVDL